MLLIPNQQRRPRINNTIQRTRNRRRILVRPDARDSDLPEPLLRNGRPLEIAFEFPVVDAADCGFAAVSGEVDAEDPLGDGVLGHESVEEGGGLGDGDGGVCEAKEAVGRAFAECSDAIIEGMIL